MARIPLLLLVAFVALLSGCAHKEEHKPWEHKKPQWWETGMDQDDREFYRQFFIQNH